MPAPQWLHLGAQLKRVSAAGSGPPRRQGLRLLCASTVYALFTVVPALIAAIRSGTERGDIREDARFFGQAYGPNVAAYFASAPRASKILELSGLVVLAVVVFLFALPFGKAPIGLRDVRRAAIGGAVLILAGHSVVYVAMLAGGGTPAIAGSWTWRLAALTLLSSAAELGAVTLALHWFGRRRWVAMLLLAILSLLGTGLRRFNLCTVPLVPTCVDASLLSGRLSDQLLSGTIAALWLGLAITLVQRARATTLLASSPGSRPAGVRAR